MDVTTKCHGMVPDSLSLVHVWGPRLCLQDLVQPKSPKICRPILSSSPSAHRTPLSPGPQPPSSWASTTPTTYPAFCTWTVCDLNPVLSVLLSSFSMLKPSEMQECRGPMTLPCSVAGCTTSCAKSYPCTCASIAAITHHMLSSGGTVTVSLNNVTIGSGSVISNVPGRRRLLALTSDFLISITVPAATQPGSLVSAPYEYTKARGCNILSRSVNHAFCGTVAALLLTGQNARLEATALLTVCAHMQPLVLSYSGTSNFNPAISGQGASPTGPTLVVVSCCFPQPRSLVSAGA